ncbi:MAG: AAA domain-containing protein, partial [Gammaproteobacteria bacterium]
DEKGECRPLRHDDIVIVARYNAQVAAILHALPDYRIGTVDRFQGQQAPVVVYSMTTSAPEEALRGLNFLYSGNRLNVATSRAQGVCILVGSPKLFEPNFTTPLHMKLANSFCRYLEIATRL